MKRNPQGAFDTTGDTSRFSMLPDSFVTQFKRDVAPGGAYDVVFGLHGPRRAYDARTNRDDFGESANRSFKRSRSETHGQIHQRRPEHHTTEYNNEAEDYAPSGKFLRSCLSDDDYEEYRRMRNEEDKGEDGDFDTPHQEKDWERQYPARDTPPPFRGKPAPGGTMTGEDARHARRFSQPSSRGRAMDHVPRSLFFGPPTPGDMQVRADRARRAMTPQMRTRRAERIATDSQPSHAVQSFEAAFPSARLIGFV